MTVVKNVSIGTAGTYACVAHVTTSAVGIRVMLKKRLQLVLISILLFELFENVRLKGIAQ